jgi:hypothetical protein
VKSKGQQVRWRWCNKWLFFAFVLFEEVLKTDNINTEDLQQQITTHFFRKYRGIPKVLKTLSLSLSRVKPNSEYGTGKERGDGSVWGYVARLGRDSCQGMHGADQKACKPGETMVQTPSPRRIGSRFLLGLCGGPSFFGFIFSFFPAFLLFFFSFLTYRTTEQGWGD